MLFSFICSPFSLSFCPSSSVLSFWLSLLLTFSPFLTVHLFVCKFDSNSHFLPSLHPSKLRFLLFNCYPFSLSVNCLIAPLDLKSHLFICYISSLHTLHLGLILPFTFTSHLYLPPLTHDWFTFTPPPYLPPLTHDWFTFTPHTYLPPLTNDWFTFTPLLYLPPLTHDWFTFTPPP